MKKFAIIKYIWYNDSIYWNILTKNGKGAKKLTSFVSFLQKVAGALFSFNFTTDLIDVILVTILIYELIKLVRGSRSFQLIKGIALLFIIFAIVKALHMEASEYLFSTLFQNGLLIIVVLFAPELRKILESFGRNSIRDISFLNFKDSVDYEKKVTESINSFCKASADMSETKTGALVVFEKKSLLQDVVDTGTIVDAKASAELFNGIFFKNSALHDGAVIVRDGRIYSAGCILPLTQSNSINSELGTRHRAAIGMSEQSDAIVVVVSEETGIVSVAKNGVLTRDVENGKLREILLDEFISDKSEESATGGKKIISKIFKKRGGDKNEK